MCPRLIYSYSATFCAGQFWTSSELKAGFYLQVCRIASHDPPLIRDVLLHYASLRKHHDRSWLLLQLQGHCRRSTSLRQSFRAERFTVDVCKSSISIQSHFKSLHKRHKRNYYGVIMSVCMFNPHTKPQDFAEIWYCGSSLTAAGLLLVRTGPT